MNFIKYYNYNSLSGYEKKRFRESFKRELKRLEAYEKIIRDRQSQRLEELMTADPNNSRPGIPFLNWLFGM